MKRLKQYLSEIFETPATYRRLPFDKKRFNVYEFTVNYYKYSVVIQSIDDDPDSFTLEFGLSDTDSWKYDVAKVGTATSIKVFTTIMTIAKEFIEKNDPLYIEFAAEKVPGKKSSRSNLYKSLLKKYCPNGYDSKVDDSDPEFTMFSISKR
jgi:hypothetical protein